MAFLRGTPPAATPVRCRSAASGAPDHLGGPDPSHRLFGVFSPRRRPEITHGAPISRGPPSTVLYGVTIAVPPTMQARLEKTPPVVSLAWKVPVTCMPFAFT
jgi:hypothetical protein